MHVFCDLIHRLVSRSMAKHASAWFHKYIAASYIWNDLIAKPSNNTCQCGIIQAMDANTGTEPPPQLGSTTPPRTCTRFGTGVLPIVTQSLMSTMPRPALASAPDEPVSATDPGLPQSPTWQPYGKHMHGSSVQSEDTGLQSTEPGFQVEGKVRCEAASHSMGSPDPTIDNAAIALDSTDAQPKDGSALEQHVWGAMLTHSHDTVSQAADDRMRTMSLQLTRKKRGAERAVTPRILHK